MHILNKLSFAASCAAVLLGVAPSIADACGSCQHLIKTQSLTTHTFDNSRVLVQPMVIPTAPAVQYSTVIREVIPRPLLLRSSVVVPEDVEVDVDVDDGVIEIEFDD